MWGRSTRCALLCAVLIHLSTPPAWAAQSTPGPEEQQEYWARFDAEDWAAAVGSAQQEVDSARAAGAAPEKISTALTQLGNAQLGQGDFAAAEATFAEALQTIEPVTRNADPKLIGPLRGLGYSVARQDRHAQALPYLEKALLITRRTQGLFDFDQRGLLQQLASSLAALGQLEEGDQHMKYLLRVSQHTYGVADPRMVPVLCTVADWYSQNGQMMEARDRYRVALAIVERRLGSTDLAAVEPLRGLARSYVRELFFSMYGVRTQTSLMSMSAEGTPREAQSINPRYLSADGERALLQAMEILDATTERPEQMLTETLLQLGDWYQIKAQPEKALPYYQRAASTLSPDGPADSQAPAQEAAKAGKSEEAVLGFPVQVYYPMPLLATRNLARPDNAIEEKFVQVEFTVTSDGTVKDQRAVDQDASPRQVSQTLEAIGNARYRPKFVQGAPVETMAVSYRQVFRQRKAD